MRARLLTIAVGVCAVISAGCSTNEATNDRARTVPQDTAAAPYPTATPAGKQLTDGQLRAALLTVQDMPTGFTLDTDARNDDSAKFEGCEQLDGLDQNTGSLPDIDVSFTKGGFGPFVSESLGQKGEVEAKDAVNKLANALSSCKTVKSRDANGKVAEFRLSALSFPKLGDDTFALRMSAEAEGLAVGIDLVVIRRSGVMILILNAGILSPDSAITETVARKALDKVEAAMA